jgi:hypothetical protein
MPFGQNISEAANQERQRCKNEIQEASTEKE